MKSAEKRRPPHERYTLRLGRAILLTGSLLLVVPTAALASPYSDLVQSHGPVSHWRLGETSGTTASDSSGSNNGTYASTPTLGQTGAIYGDNDKSARFNGSSEHVNLGTMDVSGSAMTILAWFKADDFGYSDARIISKADGTSDSNHWWMLSTISSGGSKLRFRLKTSSGGTTTLIASSGTLSTGQWVFAAAVYDGSTMKIYKDATEVGSTSKTGTLSTSSSVGVRIADNPVGSRYFDGFIDEVVIFNKALTPAEIQAIHEAALPPPVTYYVRTSGSDSSDGLSPATAWRNIDHAANTMVAGDKVYVGAGTYTQKVTPSNDGTASQPIQFIADTGGGQTGDAGSVTIRAPNNDYAINVSSDNYIHFSGFIIRGDPGNRPAVRYIKSIGGSLTSCEVYDGRDGLRVDDADLTVDTCNIRDNSGDGIEIKDDSTVVIRDSRFTDNSAKGIKATDDSRINLTVERTICQQNSSHGCVFNKATVLATNCLIVGNGSDGIKLGGDGNTDVTVWNCTIVGNSSDGIEQDNGTLTLTNCIITTNNNQGLNRDGGTMTHTYNLVYGHSTNFAGTSQSTGEIVADPLLIGSGDYHLLEGSPGFNTAIDASGVLTDDLEGNTRPQGGGWDLGCYEVDPPVYTDLVDAYTQNGPIAWWRLNEDSGASVAFDEIAANNGLYSGGATSGLTGVPIGGVNGATQFDGTDDYISAGTMDVNASAMTIVGWFKADSFATGESKILSKASGTDSASHYWALGANNTGSGVRLQFRIKAGGSTSTLMVSSANLAAGAWVFAAAVYDGSDMVLYKDGVAIGQITKTGSIDTSSSTSLWLGGNPSGATDHPFDGLIDEVAIFDKALSSMRIAAIYAGSLRGRGNGKILIPTLWGIDRDDADLFAIDDYRDPGAGTTTYGPLKWNDGGTLTPLTGLVRAMAIDNSARMYLVSSSALGSVSGPVLLRMNLEDVTQSGDNVVTVIGQMGTGSDIRGLTIDPLNDDLYAIRADGRLYLVDKKNGSVLTDIGQVAGQGESITTAEDVTFDAMGNMLVIDNGDDEIYRVDKTTAEILEVYANGNSGIGTMQGLAWDHLNQRILATDTGGDDLHYSYLSGYGAASTVSLSAQALTDVEAICFMPSEGRKGQRPGGSHIALGRD